MNAIATKPALPLFSGLKDALSLIGTLFAVLGAVIAVSAAVQNRRQPRAADLRRLGMEGTTFNLNF